MTKTSETSTISPGEQADDPGVRRRMPVSRRGFLEASTGAATALILIGTGRDGETSESIESWSDGTLWQDGAGWV